MFSFPRPGKHSNRSQNALAEPHATIAAATGGGTGGIASDSASQLQALVQNHHPDPSPQSQVQSPPQVQGQAQTQGLSPTKGQGQCSQQQSQHQQQPHTQHSQRQSHQVEPTAYASSPGSIKLSPSGEPPILSLRAGQQPNSPQPQHQELHQPLSTLNTGGGAPLPHQQHFYTAQDQTPIEVPVVEDRWRPDISEAPVNRAQSQRYSTYAAIPPRDRHYPQQEQHQPEHQQAYSLVSSSLDDLPSTASGYTSSIQQQPPPQLQSPQSPPAPEKKSRRKLIKGIFSSSSRHENHQHNYHHHQQSQQIPPQHQGPSHSHQGSYDNTAGLSRRPSKRVSKPPPALNTRLSSQGQYYQDPNWQGQESYSHETSPQGGNEAGHLQHTRVDSDREGRLLESQISQSNTIRQVSSELESPYDETPLYRQQQLQAAQQQQPHLPPRPHHSQQHSGQGLTHHHPPAPPSQPHVQLHLQQDQAHHYEQPHQARGAYDQQSAEDLAHLASQDQVYVPATLPQQISDPHSFAQTRNPETVSQASYDSPVTDSEQRSATDYSVQPSPAAGYSSHTVEFGSPPGPSTAEPAVIPGQQQPAMPQASTVNPSSRRTQDAEKMSMRGQGEGSAAPPQGYRHSNTSAGALAPVAPVAGQGSSSSPAFRGDSTPRFESATLEQGRHSPQPLNAERDAQSEDKAFKDLLIKYKNVKRLYFDGKAQIEVLGGQVEQLQNAVANQRMSQSRTALDDNEYLTRFNRLNGAINNLSFNIRKDWRSVPSWLEKYISPDALKTGKQEMTAIGRAVITRWIVDEIFEKCFHPGLDPALSSQLKEIELNIRGNAYTMTSQEEYDALTTKVVNWRMATLDGLSKILGSNATTENRNVFTTKATSNLTAWLYQYLNSPPPAGVEGSASMIVELAVGIVANLPMESRDVAIRYPLPGVVVEPDVMEVEKTGLPALESQKVESDSDSDEELEADKGKGRAEKTKSGMWTTMRNNAPPESRKGSVASGLEQIVTDIDLQSAIAKDVSRVRFAGFVALEVRGRQVLLKAPVWTI